MKGYSVALLVFIAVIFVGCVVPINTGNKSWGNNIKITETKSFEETVEVGEVKSVNFIIRMGTGKLNIGGNGDNLLDANFIYNVENWKPMLGYENDVETGFVMIKQPSVGNLNLISMNNIKYEWNLKLSKNVLYNIDASVGIAENTMDLREVRLKGLRLNLGVGKSTIDISGKYENDVDVIIEGGVGATIIYIPKEMNMEIDSEAGIGKVDIEGGNISNNNSKYTMKLKVRAGIGKISIKQK